MLEMGLTDSLDVFSIIHSIKNSAHHTFAMDLITTEPMSPDSQPHMHSSEDTEKVVLVDAQTLESFTNRIKECFPTYIASVITDKHGLVIHSQLPPSMDENMLALSAICRERSFLDLSKYQKIIRPLSQHVKIIVLLDKSRQNYLDVFKFYQLLQNENPI
jgi:hypothetical protein